MIPLDTWPSQFGQDKWLVTEIFPGKREGVFVDVGAYNGVFISNTYVLEGMLNWRGLCVEANESIFQELAKNRQCIVENVCLMDAVHSVEFLEVDGAEHFASLSGIPDYLDKKDAVITDNVTQRKIVKQSATLASLLEKHNLPRVIDFLSIDTEGSEFLILKNFPFEKYTFLAIIIEHNHHPVQKSLQRSLLSRNNYVLIKTHAVDDYWLHRKCPGFYRILLRQRFREILITCQRRIQKLRSLLGELVKVFARPSL